MKHRILFISCFVAVLLVLLSQLSFNVQSATKTISDDFSSYALGNPPSGWTQYGTTAITPRIVNYGGSGSNFLRLEFPANTSQSTYKYLIREESAGKIITAKVKLNFKSSSDGAGLVVAWKDTGNYIGIFPNPFWDEIVVWEFANGQIRSTFNQLGRYSVPINTNQDYWLRVIASQSQAGGNQLDVEWSTDGTNFSKKTTASNLANLTGQVGVGTFQFLSNVLFDNFSVETDTPIASVPDYKQFTSPTEIGWEKDLYNWQYKIDENGNYVTDEHGIKIKVNGDNSTIKDYGCFITSAVDIMRYWNITTATNNLDVNPRTLNDYLSNEYVDKDNKPIGYLSDVASWAGIQAYSGKHISISNLIISSGQSKEEALDAKLTLDPIQPVMVSVPYPSKVIFNVPLSLNYQYDLDRKVLSPGLRQEFVKNNIVLSADNKLFIKKINTRWWVNDTELDHGNRGYFVSVNVSTEMLAISPGYNHWVVIVGPKNNDHYPINDPGSSTATNLGSYGDADAIGRMLLIEKTTNDIKTLMRIAAHSPVELLVTDQSGRRTGYDPVTSTMYTEIPNGEYVHEEPIVNLENGETIGESEKVLYLAQPDIGSYKLTLRGTGEGPYTIDFQTIDDNGIFSNQSVVGMASMGSKLDYSYTYDVLITNLEVINQPPSLTVSQQVTGQYSDEISITANAFDPDDISSSLTFTAIGLPDNLSFIDNKDGTGIISGKLQVAPGNYLVSLAVTDPDGLKDIKSVVITVNPEDTKVMYTDPMLVSTGCSTCTSALIPLRATIQDITAVDPVGDPYPGDIRNANITFVNRDNANAVLCTAVPVLLEPNDSKTGSASCNWNADIGSNSGLDFNVGLIVGGYFLRNSTDDNTVVVVSKPGTDFLTGGGYFTNLNSTGLYAGDPGSKTNFGLNIKFNNKLTNLQGLVTIMVRMNGRIYQIESNLLSSLVAVPYDASKPSTGIGELVGYANITDITNPLNPVSLQSEATLQISVKDNGEPGKTDMISISVWGKDGKLLFSSNWNGTKTMPQTIDGGNLQVH